VGIEPNVVMSVLKLTVNGQIPNDLISREANLPLRTTEELLSKLQNEGLISMRGNLVEVTFSQRADLGAFAVQHGADPLTVSALLSWQEFESISAIAFERNGYRVAKNLRFRQGGRKWEMDIIGMREPLLVCADCKQWRHGLNLSALQRITEAQVARAKALSCSPSMLFEKLKCNRTERITLVPVVISLIATKSKFYSGTPIVPVFQLHDFLNQLPLHLDTLLCLSSGACQKTGEQQQHKSKDLKRERQKIF